MMTPNRVVGNLGEILLREGIINNAQLDEALRRQRETDLPLGRILVEMGAITESVKMSFLKRQLGYDLVSLSGMEIPPLTFTLIPRHVATKHHLVPIRMERDGLVVAMEDPSDIVLLDNLKTLVGMRIKPVIASTSDIEEALEQYPAEKPEAAVLVARPPTLLYRLIRYTAFPIFCFLPIVIIIYILCTNTDIQLKLAKLNEFDVFLYTLLGWGLWAVILYEINGLIFERPSGPKESVEKEKEK
jgi:hypothetical protein